MGSYRLLEVLRILYGREYQDLHVFIADGVRNSVVIL